MLRYPAMAQRPASPELWTPRLDKLSLPFLGGNAHGMRTKGTGISFGANGMRVARTSPITSTHLPNSRVGWRLDQDWWFGVTMTLGYSYSDTWAQNNVDHLNFVQPNGAGTGVVRSRGLVCHYRGDTQDLELLYLGMAGQAGPKITAGVLSFLTGDTLRIVGGKSGRTVYLWCKYGPNSTQSASYVEPGFADAIDWNWLDGEINIGCSPAWSGYGDYASGSDYRYFTLRQAPPSQAIADAYIANPQNF